MKHRKTTEKFKEELSNLKENEYEVIGEYKHGKEKIEIKHKKCDKNFHATPNNLLHKTHPTGCPFCYGNFKKTTNEFKKQIFDLVGNEYNILDEYKDTLTSINFKHNICGKIFLMRPRNFIQGQRCPDCSGFKRKKLHEEFVKEVEDLEKKKYVVLENYINDSTKIKIYHKTCSTTYYVTPRDFLNGHRCPTCKSRSKGELRIKKYLEQNKINYKSQFYYNNLRSPKGRLLKFDFAILDKNNNVKLLIEFDGPQHYYVFWDKEEFERIKQYDKLKNDYCKLHNLQLLRISFKEKNEIETILEKMKI